MKPKQIKFLSIPLLVILVFLAVVTISLQKVGNTEILYRFDAPIHDRLYRIRNFLFPNQPISQDIALVGIDDYTVNQIGQFGKGIWLTRAPFISQIRYCQESYHPAVLAYDLIFADFEGKEDHLGGGSLEKKDLLAMSMAINDLADEKIPEIDNKVLRNVAKLTSAQGSGNLATALSSLTDNEEHKTQTIIAYDCIHPSEGININRGWTIEAILGSDDSDLSEENGTELPYLKDVSIPMEYVSGLPEDFQFSKYAQLPTKSLLDYSGLGYINVPRDEGGVVRRIPLVQGLQVDYKHPTSGHQIRRQFFLPSLALLCCLSYWDIDLAEMNMLGKYERKGSPIIKIDWGNHITIQKPTGEIVRIPIDEFGNFYLDYVGWVGDFNSISFANVGPYKAIEEGKDILSRKIALVGLTATGSSDVGPTPIHDNTPFVFVHMTAISNILTNTFISPLTRKENLLILSLICLILLPISTFFQPLKFSYCTLILMLLYSILVFFLINTHRYLLPIAGPMLLFISTYLGVILFYYFSEARERIKIRGMFSTMVSGEVLEFLEQNPGSFALEGRRADATMFFSDVAGFTTISESLSPEKLVDLLNQYLSPMTEIILNSHGYVDKYEGDAIMAEWGVPFPIEDHAILACFAALDQQKTLAELRPKFVSEFGISIDVRMGLNSGAVSAGNMGSEKRMSYTVMGDAVNQAARFEPANKDYGTSIMIGATTYDLAKDAIEARLLDKIVVKGKSVPIKIYELVGKKGEITQAQEKIISFYDDGLRYYWDRKWENSKDCLDKALKLSVTDGPSLELMRRVNQFMISPPSEEWQGEYVKTTKD